MKKITVILATILTTFTCAPTEDAQALTFTDGAPSIVETQKTFVEVMERAFKAFVDTGEPTETVCFNGICAKCVSGSDDKGSYIACTISGYGFRCTGGCASDVGCSGSCQ